MQVDQNNLEVWISQSSTREHLWGHILNSTQVKSMAELGVYRGHFAETMLKNCTAIEHYIMIDPWRHLQDWNKPANKNNEQFELFYNEAMSKTEFAANKRQVLRGTTTEVVDNIGDESLDFAYIDGDHTLKGITIDLIKLYPKIKQGGMIGGDDYSPSIWQHMTKYEPTLVFPFALYFAEAVGARIYSLPYAQFLIEKTSDAQFSHIDLTGDYLQTDLQAQLTTKRLLRSKFKDITRSFRSYWNS